MYCHLCNLNQYCDDEGANLFSSSYLVQLKMLGNETLKMIFPHTNLYSWQATIMIRIKPSLLSESTDELDF